MGSIVLLDDQTINKIAAGEVIERPANVVKEMCENSIDAGATAITIEIENGGITSIRITDNGKGIAPDDIALSFERHATSKIRRAEDLLKVSTMGFRGEALASIASISKMEMITRTKDQDLGIKVKVENGEIIEQEECGASVGTTILVKELFYNTPVRYKFLKKDFTEGGYVEDTVSKIALINPGISFKLINNKKTVLQTSGNGDMKTVIYSVYGKDVANNIINVDAEYEGYKVTGVCGKPEIARSNRSNQLFYVNGRNIRDKVLSTAVDKAYGTLLHEGRYAFCVINIKMSPELVDVNVHPAKLEVRFQEEGKIFSAITMAIKSALFSQDLTVIDDEETIKESVDGLRKPKEGFFDKYRPTIKDDSNASFIKNENISYSNATTNSNSNNINDTTNSNATNQIEESITNDIISEEEENVNSNNTLNEDTNNEKKSNVISIDFKKEISLLKEDSEKYFNSNENNETSNIEDSEDDDIDISKLNMNSNEGLDLKQFNLTDEDFERTNFVNKKNLFDPKNQSFGTMSNVPIVGKEDQTNIFSNISRNTNNPNLPEYQILGVGFLTYIFVQIEDEIYIFDQHAAHERVLYEKVKANYYKDGGKESQMLLLPDVLELSKKDMKLVVDHMDIFKNAGFELEEFGENTIRINGVPAICYDMNTRDLFLDIIDGMDFNSKTTTQEVENRFLATVACKAAVKANMKLSEVEIKTLFDELLVLENPFTCPHGRPTAIRLTKDEIEKKFKRKGF